MSLAVRLAVAVLVLLALSGPARGAITVNKCQAGKKKCAAKEMSALLACHVKAEKKGALDPTCLAKAKAKLDGGAKPAKGCFARLEKKGHCLTTGDTAAVDAEVQAFVLDVVQALDPTYPAATVSKCGAGKKACVAKDAAALLACHAKGSLKGTLNPTCVAKATSKYDGGAKPAKGCFAKLEAKGGCTTTADSSALQTTTDGFLDTVLCTLDPSEGTCTSGGSCTAPGFSGSDPTLTVTSVTATVTDLGGTPVSHLEVQVTGLNLSFASATDTSGNVMFSPGFQLHRPAFRYGDALTYPLLAVPLTAATSVLGTLATAPLPASGAAFAPGGSATSGPVTVTLEPGAQVAVDTLTYDTPDKQALRAVALPVDKESAILDPSLNLALLFGAAPVETLFCPPAQITVPNDLGWPANAAVEFYIAGSDVVQAWAPYAGWTKISDGNVSADAATVSTSATGGFPILEAVFAVRLASF